MIKRMLSLLIILFILCSLTDTAYSAQKKSRQRSAQTQEVRKTDPHSYYKGLTKAQGEEADKIAKYIAQKVMAEKSLNTDLKKSKGCH